MENEELVNLRDFIYLDVDRLKSLLAQLDRGLLDSSQKTVGSSTSAGAKAGVSIPSLFDFGGSGQYVRENHSSETRTLHDFVYNQVEERLIKLKRMRILPDDFNDGCNTGDVRSSLSSVEYVLIKGTIEFGDYDYLIDLLGNVNKVVASIARLPFYGQAAAAPAKDKSSVLADMNRAVASSALDEKYIKDLLVVFNQFLKGRLNVKAMPFDQDLDFRVTGPLRRDCLRESMEVIRSKYGSFPHDRWCVFCQIATIPMKIDMERKRDISFKNELEKAIDVVFRSLMGIEDQFKINFPEIAITPIAIYRD